MKTINVCFAVLFACATVFGQQKFVSLPLCVTHNPVKAIENVSDLPKWVISIEQTKSGAVLKFRDGKEESFDLFKEEDLKRFKKILGVARVDQLESDNVELDKLEFNKAESNLKVLGTLSPAKGLLAIRSDNDSVKVDVIPSEVVRDRKQLKKRLRRYEITIDE